jgi:hypothetical protein
MNNYYQIANDFLNERIGVTKGVENTYIPKQTAIDDADRASFWNHYDLMRIKLIGKIKRAKR